MCVTVLVNYDICTKYGRGEPHLPLLTLLWKSYLGEEVSELQPQFIRPFLIYYVHRRWSVSKTVFVIVNFSKYLYGSYLSQTVAVKVFRLAVILPPLIVHQGIANWPESHMHWPSSQSKNVQYFAAPIRFRESKQPWAWLTSKFAGRKGPGTRIIKPRIGVPSGESGREKYTSATLITVIVHIPHVLQLLWQHES